MSGYLENAENPGMYVVTNEEERTALEGILYQSGEFELCKIQGWAQTQQRVCLGVIPYFLLNIRLKFDRFENPHFCEISRIESLVDVSIARASVTRKSFTYEIKLIPVWILKNFIKCDGL